MTTPRPFGKNARKTIYKPIEPRLCPTCWNAMSEVKKGVWDCAKHGDPRVWENRLRPRSKPLSVAPMTVQEVPAVGLPERLKEFLPPDGNRRRFTEPIRQYLYECVDKGETAGQVAVRIWKDMGYKNSEAAKGTFYKALRERKEVRHQ